MAFNCLKCGERVYNPEAKCPQCGAEVASEEQWHAYLTFFAVACVVALGSPFGSWCVQWVLRLFTRSSGILPAWQGASAAYIGVITATVLAAMAAIIAVEKWMKKRQSKEP